MMISASCKQMPDGRIVVLAVSDNPLTFHVGFTSGMTDEVPTFQNCGVVLSSIPPISSERLHSKPMTVMAAKSKPTMKTWVFIYVLCLLGACAFTWLMAAA